MSKRKTTEEFIEDAIKMHGDKYDYSKVEYINAKTKVCIICKEHGAFWQMPNVHLYGHGCPKCKCDKLYNERKKSNELFIKDAIKNHGNKYDYSKVEYINAKTKVCIICPIHGEFWQRPINHLRGQGCPMCSSNKKLTTEELKKRCEEIYGDKIITEKTIYKTAREKIIVTCPIHGDFETTPDNLLHKHFCPKCKESKLEKYVREIFDKNEIKYEYQKRFNWLGRQSIDFYLPEHKIAIECQGIQHYKPVDFAGKGDEWANKAFEGNIKRDKIKLDKVLKHNICMIYVNEENKDKFLNEIL